MNFCEESIASLFMKPTFLCTNFHPLAVEASKKYMKSTKIGANKKNLLPYMLILLLP